MTFTIKDAEELNRHIDAIRLIFPCLSDKRKWELKDTVSHIASLSDIKPDYWTLKQLFSLVTDANTWLFESADATPRDSVDQPE